MTPYIVQQYRLDAIRSLTGLSDALDVTEAAHDDVADLLLQASELVAMAKAAQVTVNARVVEWLRSNSDGVDSVAIGEKVYSIDKAPKKSLRDVKATAEALLPLVCPGITDGALRASLGDEEAAAKLVGYVSGIVGDFAASVVSADGLKAGACRAYLGEAFGDHWETTWPKDDERKLTVKNSKFQKGKAP